MLDISEAEAGVLKLEKEALDVDPILRSLADMYTYGAEEYGTRIEVRIEESRPLSADRVRFQQVVANLLDNAMKFTPPGTTVVLSFEPHDDGSALISVADRGPGIPIEEINRIWDRMFRNGPQAGHGLGLSLVKAIVEAHNGAVAAANRADGGAELRISWPFA
jgi:signal transduction histidine kinase